MKAPESTQSGESILVPVVSIAEMAEIDRISIEDSGMDGGSLMEQAAAAMWGRFLQHCRKSGNEPAPDDPFLFLCGSGNNGGDGLAMAVLAYQAGFRRINLLLSRNSGSPLFEHYLAQCRRLGMTVYLFDKRGPDAVDLVQKSRWLFEALTGTGSGKELDPKWSTLAGEWNRSSGFSVAVDLPAGIAGGEGSTGRNSLMFRADLTLAVEFPKRAFYHPFARSGCGRISFCPIGFPAQAVEQVIGRGHCFLITGSCSKLLLASPDPAEVYKNSRGRVTLFAGSTRYPGAALLCAMGASAATGFLRLVTDPKTAFSAVSQLPSLVIPHEPSLLTQVLHQRRLTGYYNSSSDIAVLGPGWGKSLRRRQLLKLLFKSDLPLILDADALNFISRSTRLRRGIMRRGDCLLTPHPGEFRRLIKSFGLSASASIDEQAVALARKANAVVLLKGAVSRVAHPGGTLLIFDSCRAHLATAGTGDLLAGLTASLYTYSRGSRLNALVNPVEALRSEGALEAQVLWQLAAAALSALEVQALAGDLSYGKSGWAAAGSVAAQCGKVLAGLMPSLQAGGEAFAHNGSVAQHDQTEEKE